MQLLQQLLQTTIYIFIIIVNNKPYEFSNCRGSIRDELKIISGSYVKRAQTISFVKREFERLGLGHRTVGWVGSGQLTSSKESGELYALVILLVFRTPWLGRADCPPSSLSYSLLTFYTSI